MYLLKFIEDWPIFSKGEDKLNSADLHIHQLYHKYSSFKKHLSWPSDFSYPGGFLLPVLVVMVSSLAMWCDFFNASLVTCNLLLLLSCSLSLVCELSLFLDPAYSSDYLRVGLWKDQCSVLRAVRATHKCIRGPLFHSVRNLLPIKKQILEGKTYFIVKCFHALLNPTPMNCVVEFKHLGLYFSRIIPGTVPNGFPNNFLKVK